MNTGHPLPLSARELLEHARAVAKVDLDDSAALEPLSALVESFNQDGQLHEAGAKSVQDRLLRSLVNRLRMLRDFKAHPEIREQRILKPLFIGGYLRTGSTKLQRMLAASGDFNYLPLWTTLNPSLIDGIPGEPIAPRIADAERFVEDLYTGSPEAASIHEQGAHLPEEESYIFCQDLRCAGYLSYANVTGYLGWLATQDMLGTYEYLLDTLKYLQWQGLADPDKRWLLKSPFHMGQEAVLARVFPDASLVFTHRPPAQFLASMCSLMVNYMKWHTDHTVVDGRLIAAGFAHSMEQHFAFRADPSLPMLDVDYRDVTTHATEVIERIYRHAGLPCHEASMQAMTRWETDNPIHKHGGHRYALEDFGLSAAALRQMTARYDDFYVTTFPERAQ